MENNRHDEPEPGCVHLLLHYAGDATLPLRNVDPDRYSYLDLIDDISRLLDVPTGCNDDRGLPFSISFCHPGSHIRIPINTDSHILDMFKLNSNCIYIHLYVMLRNFNDNQVDRAEPEIVTSESDDEWQMTAEPQQNEGGETDSVSSYIDEEEMKNENSDDGLSDYEEKYDVIAYENSDEDKVPIYVDRGMKGKLFDHESDGKVKLEQGLLFGDVDEFRAALRDFVIQEGFEIKRIKNEKARVTAKCASDGCSWRIHASPTPDGKTYKIKTYNHVHSCIRLPKNSNATSTWIATKLESKLKAEPNMSYASMSQELLDRYGIEPTNVTKLYRARNKVKQDNKGIHALSYNDLPAWAFSAFETNPGSIIKLELEPRLNKNPEFKRFFVCLNAMKNGFVRGCRPWFGIDGCHLKGPYGGVLLSAVAIDGNKGMFPIAFAVVEIECKDSWMFFLSLLRDSLSSVSEWKDRQVTIMSDMQKVGEN
jgi:hypothetical protein